MYSLSLIKNVLTVNVLTVGQMGAELSMLRPARRGRRLKHVILSRIYICSPDIAKQNLLNVQQGAVMPDVDEWMDMDEADIEIG